MKTIFLITLIALVSIAPVKADTGSPVPIVGDLLAPVGVVNVPASGSTTVNNAKVIKVNHGQALSLFPSFNLANAGSSTANVTFNFSTGPGTLILQTAYGTTNVIGVTNMTTINTNYSVTFALNGAVNQVGLYYIPAGGAECSFTIGTIANAANNSGGVNVSNIWYRLTSLSPTP